MDGLFNNAAGLAGQHTIPYGMAEIKVMLVSCQAASPFMAGLDQDLQPIPATG
jgi:hypothetical protein